MKRYGLYFFYYSEETQRVRKCPTNFKKLGHKYVSKASLFQMEKKSLDYNDSLIF